MLIIADIGDRTESLSTPAHIQEDNLTSQTSWTLVRRNAYNARSSRRLGRSLPGAKTIIGINK